MDLTGAFVVTGFAEKRGDLLYIVKARSAADAINKVAGFRGLKVAVLPTGETYLHDSSVAALKRELASNFGSPRHSFSVGAVFARENANLTRV